MWDSGEWGVESGEWRVEGGGWRVRKLSTLHSSTLHYVRLIAQLQQPLVQRRVRAVVTVEAIAQLAEGAVVLGVGIVSMDAFEVLLAGHHESSIGQSAVEIEGQPQHLSHHILDKARIAVGLVDHEELVGAFE